MSLPLKEYRYPLYTDEGYNIEMVLPNTPKICVFVCVYMYVCICIYSEALFSCFFLNRANRVVCSVLCSFCTWSL